MKTLRFPCLVAALRYARRGWLVHPLKARQKIPRLREWPSKATSDPAQVKVWWAKRPHDNVGIVTGRASRLVVVETDGEAGEVALRQILQKDPPATYTVRSGSGRGLHRYFEYPQDGLGVPSSTGKDALRPKLEVFADGGRQVAAPPSVHPSGGKYRVIADLPLATLPKKLLHEVRQRHENDRPSTASRGFTLPRVIPEHQRNDTLFRYASYLRGRGQNETEVLNEILIVNRDRCSPSLDDSEVESVVRGVVRRYEEAARLDDLGNARRVVLRNGEELRYLKQVRKWLHWDGQRWAFDETGEAERRAKGVVRSLDLEVAREENDQRREALRRHAARSAAEPRVRSMLTLASTEPEMVIRIADLDPDPWALNVLNGTLDLRTMRLRPHDRNDLITKLAPVVFDSGATAPLWQRFLAEVMAPNPEVVSYLRRAIGYTLSGSTREHAFFLTYGSGANGKSTFLETVRALLGDYSRHADFDTFLSSRSERIRNDVARLAGARFVTAMEAEEGRQFAEALLKHVTGGDTVAARFLFQEATEYRPQFKLWLATNHKPSVSGTDDAFWRRVRVVPFAVNLPPERRDKDLAEKLKGELPGILNWALEGCLDWQLNGLSEPKTIRHETSTYRQEQDVVADFLKDCYTIEDGSKVEAPSLRRDYIEWCHDSGESPLGGKRLNRRLVEHGLVRRKSNGIWWWNGIRRNEHSWL